LLWGKSAKLSAPPSEFLSRITVREATM